jgi:hypothetical protein
MAGVGPEATRVFGRNAQTAVIPKRLATGPIDPLLTFPTNLIRTENARKSVRRRSE